MADCCEWTGTALLRPGVFAPQGLRTFENITALRAFRVSTPQNGMLVWVLSVEDAFEYQSDSALDDDGITIVTPVSNIGRWIRLKFPNERWARQATWHIDVAGNDENAGDDATRALKTHAEFARRVNGLTLSGNVTVVIHSDLPEPLELNVKLRMADNHTPAVPITFLTYVGLPLETFWSHTVSSASAVDPTANPPLAPTLVDNLVTDWSAAMSGRLRIVGGTRDGAIGWPVRVSATTPTEIRTSVFGTSDGASFTAVVPENTDTYVAERLPFVRGVNMNIRGLGGVCTFESIGISVPRPTFVNVMQGSVSYTVRNCMLVGVHFSANAAFLVNCFVGPNEDSNVSLEGTVFVRGGTSGRGYTVPAMSQAFFSDDHLIEGTGDHNHNYSGVIVEGYATLDPVGFFDNGNAVVVQSGGLAVSGTIYGAGMTDKAIQIGPAATLVYRVLPNITLATAGPETKIGGQDKSYTDLPFFNTANGAAIVSQT